ncbi:MAG: sensor histidine kinase, partial [Lachnospiraceae bacterium]|nr:sensor histidine kinase [Lachnospiraceae bacterium]
SHWTENPYVYEFPVYYSGWDDNPEERLTVVIDGTFAKKDIFSTIYELSGAVYPYRYGVPMASAISILLALGLFYFLMCSAGYRNGEEGMRPGMLAPVHLEIITVVYAVVLCLGIIAVHEMATRSFMGNLVLVISFLILALLWTVSFCREVAVRIKLGILFKQTLVYCILHFLWKILKKLGQVLRSMLCWVPLVHKTILIFLFICFLELMGLLIWGDEELVVLWILEKLILLPVCIYVASLCKKLLYGTEALAEGKLSYKVDTEKMFGEFKEHGENLNQISLGIARAVDERTKSERMKTELITNVSHDLKTPLTSIINYADLVGNEPTENEKIREYAEVLLRQSKRLKKLLDDLLEASKATTGTLECHFVPCEVGVLLTQAAGEYEKPFAEKGLELIMDRTEEDVTVIADGKHMWRVFDNLLNNICKYSQEHSRVYVSLRKTEREAEIIFRNMSKYALNVSAEELEERFVRGDKSRNMEGNGLGLSIARSLVELQHGQMQVVTDGDLFKVILKFELMEANE